MRRIVALAFLPLVPVVLVACKGPDRSASLSQRVPAAGGRVSFGDTVTVQFPPGAVPGGTEVTIRKGVGPHDSLDGGQSLGSAFSIDIGGQTLSTPVTLEIAFDPNKLPKGSSADQAFLATYDQAKNVWIPVPSHVDTQRKVITVQTGHLSWWNPFSWNWGAWIAVLNKGLTGNVTDFLQAVALLTNDCPQRAATVSVDASQANNVLQGCVERDDPSSPQLRIVNPKSFFFEVKPIAGGNGYPPFTMLGPGDDLTFRASTTDPAPLVVQAEITQKAGLYLIVHLVIQMLPGLNEIGIQGSQLACITEKLADLSYFISASESLLVAHDGAGAAEQLVRFLNDADALRRFITGASDCSYGPAQTWSVEGITQVGTATATILSATDFVANYLLSSKAHVAFVWTRLSPTPTRVPARAGIVIGTLLAEGQDTFLVESATGNRYLLAGRSSPEYFNAPVYAIGSMGGGAMSYTTFGRMLNSQGGCRGVLRKTGGSYFVDPPSDRNSSCEGVEVIDSPATKLDPLVGNLVALRFRGCTATREGRLVNPTIFLASEEGANAPFAPLC